MKFFFVKTQSWIFINKVQGTLIKSECHSENGQEPVGQISVTKYSSDPKDFGKNDNNSKKGITSITTTQKFGYTDTPSLKTLTSSQNVRIHAWVSKIYFFKRISGNNWGWIFKLQIYQSHKEKFCQSYFTKVHWQCRFVNNNVVVKFIIVIFFCITIFSLPF